MTPPTPRRWEGNKQDTRGKMRTSPRSTQVLGMLNMLAMIEEGEITCDQVFPALGEFAEMAERGQDVAHLMPLVEKHLTMCAGCREEYEALIAILAT